MTSFELSYGRSFQNTEISPAQVSLTDVLAGFHGSKVHSDGAGPWDLFQTVVGASPLGPGARGCRSREAVQMGVVGSRSSPPAPPAPRPGLCFSISPALGKGEGMHLSPPPQRAALEHEAQDSVFSCLNLLFT